MSTPKGFSANKTFVSSYFFTPGDDRSKVSAEGVATETSTISQDDADQRAIDAAKVIAQRRLFYLLNQ